MAVASLTTDVRRVVAETFAHLGLSAGAEPCETILIRDGVYCGRRFDAEKGHAIWFLEEEQLKFFKANGTLVQVVEPVAAAPVTRRRAA